MRRQYVGENTKQDDWNDDVDRRKFLQDVMSDLQGDKIHYPGNNKESPLKSGEQCKPYDHFEEGNQGEVNIDQGGRQIDPQFRIGEQRQIIAVEIAMTVVLAYSRDQ